MMKSKELLIAGLLFSPLSLLETVWLVTISFIGALLFFSIEGGNAFNFLSNQLDIMITGAIFISCRNANDQPFKLVIFALIAGSIISNMSLVLEGVIF